jgi:hypothetical protein
MLNGTYVGYCTGVTVNENIEYQAIEPLDTIHTVEHAEVAYRVTGTCDFIRVIGNPATKYSAFANPGDLLGGIAAVTMQIIDGADGTTVLYSIRGWKPESRSFRVEGRTLAGENVTFVAQYVIDEFTSLKPPSLVPSASASAGYSSN